MKVILFSGFLGSGKTVAILSLARYLMKGKKEGRNRLVIIENEVGETGIDDEVLTSAGYKVQSLLSGCICCTLSTDLTKTLNDIGETYAPEYVIFEPTGIAFPHRITDTLKTWGADIEWIRQVTVVDAPRWGRIRQVTPALVEAQVASADCVLLNKCDLAGEETLERTEAELRILNPQAELRRVVAAQDVDESIWRTVLEA